MSDDLTEKKIFCLMQIEYLEKALTQYKLDLAEVEKELSAQTAAA